MAVMLVGRSLPFHIVTIQSGREKNRMNLHFAKLYPTFDKGCNNIWLNKNIDS